MKAQQEPGNGNLCAQIDASTRRDVLFVGDTFCDLVFAGVEAPRPGHEVWASGFAIALGGVATRAVAAARLGAGAALLTRLGADPLGNHLAAMLESEPRLDTTLVETVDGWQTPVSVAITSEADRSFITYQEPQAAHTLSEAGLDFGAVQVSVADGELPLWIAELRRRGAVVYGGVGWDETGEWSQDIFDRLANVDVFIPNEDEALRYTRTDDPVAAAKKLAEHVPLAFVTRGADGVVAVDAVTGSVIEVPAPRVRAVDPTGAGDVFAAGFIASAAVAQDGEDWSLRDRVRFAALAASISVTRLGGASSAPSFDDVVAFADHFDLDDRAFLDHHQAAIASR